MFSAIVVLIILACGWQSYRKARRNGSWSNRQFFLTLLAALAIGVLIPLPFFLLSPETVQAHEGLVLVSMLTLILAGVTLIAVYSNRWRKRNQLKRSGEDHAVAIMLAGLLALGASGASAQTYYEDPGGNFSVKVPAGWSAQRVSENEVKISKGNASVSFDVAPTDDGSTPSAKDVLADLEKQLKEQCPQAEVVKRSEITLAGEPGVSAKITCKDPKHGTALTTIAVATTHGKILVGNMTAYAGEYAGVKAEMEGIASSIWVRGSEAARRASAESKQQMQTMDGQPYKLYDRDPGENAQKLKALESACASGVLTPEECAAKRAALSQGNAATSASNAQLQALLRACDAAVFTAEECAAKRAALTGSTDAASGQIPGPGQNSSPVLWQSNDPNAVPPDSGGQRAWHSDSSRQPAGGGTGSLFQDAHGAFSIIIPQGWTAKARRGCYGPEEGCPRDASGVNIQSPGRSWAFVAPFSGDARQPTDVVNAVADHIRSDYQNFRVLQNDPDKLNGLNVAIGHFTAVEGGEGVSLVVIGIAAPGGRFFVAESSVPQSEIQSVSPALSSMPASLRFAGQ